ncbi:hypothetical protein LTR53_005627 [Teratosphaeriaceae sp. CCFEE 6253]|nr:hypothetical protein LTR53_005627 [Teratosphaeriaceae sp. CCFEE 6253]
MDGTPEAAAEPLHRATKRRKVFRRRTDDDHSGDASEVADPAALSTSIDTTNGDGPAIPRSYKPSRRKHGIAFTSSAQSSRPIDEANEEIALVPLDPDGEQEVVQRGRFVKPTGKAAVVDDKHMMAFVDSKLAEMRATSSSTASDESSAGEAMGARGGTGESTTAQAVAAAQTTNRVQQRRQQTTRQPRSNRRHPPRGAQDLARDSLIEDLMRESNTGSALFNNPTIASSTLASTTDEVGAEDAAAEAFKAQFLQDMEAQNRRRPPAPPPFSKVAQAKGADRTAHGPKLGGSRQQRERMKAAQAAEEAAGKAKK